LQRKLRSPSAWSHEAKKGKDQWGKGDVNGLRQRGGAHRIARFEKRTKGVGVNRGTRGINNRGKKGGDRGEKDVTQKGPGVMGSPSKRRSEGALSKDSRE